MNNEKFENLYSIIAECEEFKAVKYRLYSLNKSITEDLLMNDNEIPPILARWYKFAVLCITSSDISLNDFFYFLLLKSNDYNSELPYFPRDFLTICNLFSPKKESSVDSMKLSKIIKKRENLEPYLNLSIKEIAVYTMEVINIINRKDRLNLFEMIDFENLENRHNKNNLTKLINYEFYEDGLKNKSKLYIYNRFINKKKYIDTDSFPAFAHVFNKLENCEIYYRIDENLLIDDANLIDVYSLKHEKLYGPSFDYGRVKLDHKKTITVHMDEHLNKMVLIIKKGEDLGSKELFWHVEIEELKFIDNTSNIDKNYEYIFTNFIHGIFYPNKNYFTHIDFTINQYTIDHYQEKFNDTTHGDRIDSYVINNEEHYKIWCVENGDFEIDVWIELIRSVLSADSFKLFSEVLSKNI